MVKKNRVVAGLLIPAIVALSATPSFAAKAKKCVKWDYGPYFVRYLKWVDA